MRSNHAVIEERSRVAAGAIDTLLRAELAACEAYRAAIHAVEVSGESPALALRSLYRMHRRFADELHRLLADASDEEDAGAHGAWVIAARKVASAGRDASATVLSSLRSGERASLEHALGTLRDLPGGPAEFVRVRYAPGLASNLELLSALMGRDEDEPEAGSVLP